MIGSNRNAVRKHGYNAFMLFQRRNNLRWLWVLIPILILILIGSGIAFTRGQPVITNIFPPPNMVAVPGLAPIQISFSRAMNPEAVEQGLTIEPDQPGEFVWEENTLAFTPTDPWPGGAVISVALGTGARTSLGIPLAEEQVWSFTVARTMLAYLWPANGPANLYMLDPVGGAVVQLTEMGGLLEFAVSTNGLLVYFSAYNETGGSSLWQLDMLTRESDLVLDCGSDLCSLPQPSPDGQWLVYENTTLGEVWLLSLENAEPSRLGAGTRPVWSSDGNLVFYDRAGMAFRIVDPAGTILASFANQLGEPGAWSPDGNFFAAPESDAGADSSRLLAFLPINGIVNDLSGDGLVEDTSPAYSPNGQWLAFARKYLDIERWTPGRQLWVMESDGENAYPLTNDEFYTHTSFAWSPNNQQIAFVRAHRTSPGAPPEIWVVNVDGSDPVQLVIGGYSPQWIP